MYIGSRFCARALLGCALLAAQAQNPPEHAMLPMEGIRLAPRIRYQALGSGTLAVSAGGLIALAILAGELWCGLWLLGQRFEHYDLSGDPRA